MTAKNQVRDEFFDDLLKPKSIKKELNRWSKKTTIHLISNIINSKNMLSRLLWTLFMLIFSFVLMQKINSLIVDYFNYESVTKIKLEKFDAHQHQTHQFPIVTIYNRNWINFKKYFDSSDSVFSLDQFIKSVSNDSREDSLVAKKDFLASYLVKLGQSNHLMSHLNFSNTEIVSCRYRGVRCDANDFKIIDLKSDGIFYQLDVSTLMSQSSSSNSNDHMNHDHLDLIVFSGFKTSQSPLSGESYGLNLYINQNKETFLENDRSISFRPGNHVDLVLKRERVNLLPEPFNFCFDHKNPSSININDSTLFDQVLNMTGAYSQKYCFELCYQKNLIEFCDCFDDKLISYVNYDVELLSCEKKFDSIDTDGFGYLNYEDYLLSCPNLFRDAFYASDYISMCESSCPKECEYTIYEPTISESLFPSSYFARLMLTSARVRQLFFENGYDLKTLREEEQLALLRESMISFRIKLNKETSTQIEQVPLKSFIDLISELGENLGMFLGLSILSAFEIIDLIFKILGIFLIS